MIVNQLPPAFGRAGRGDMLLRMLNQQRPPLVGVRPPMPQGHATAYGRGWNFNQPAMRPPHNIPAAQGSATIQQDIQPMQIPPLENWTRTTATSFSCEQERHNQQPTTNQGMERSALKTE
jgi:hypothetical protein